MKTIKLTKGLFATVDNEDYDFLIKFNWHSDFRKSNVYARTFIKGLNYYMHRIIMNIFDSHVFVDHKDGDCLNNQKNNLRLCTNQQNLFNRRVNKNNSLGVKGVCYNEKLNKYQSFISFNNKSIYIGSFLDLNDAKDAYINKAKDLFGEFARINI